jgi:cell division protein FtsZ
MSNAVAGLKTLEKYVDTLIVVPNDRVAALCQSNISLMQAFRQADEVLYNGVRAISELITVPGLINLDFADVRTIMQSKGRALMGIGTADGENRAVRAAEEAIVCPLLEQSNINGAMGVIVNIKGGSDIGMREVQEAITVVKNSAHPDANIIFGAVIDENERPDLQVTAIAAGFASGVSDEFLAPTEETMPQAKPVATNTEREIPEMAANEAQTDPSRAELVLNPDVPESLDLFPADRDEDQQEEEKEEDVGIPTFLRNRKKLRKKSP